jgi:hypothetical protein
MDHDRAFKQQHRMLKQFNKMLAIAQHNGFGVLNGKAMLEAIRDNKPETFRTLYKNAMVAIAQELLKPYTDYFAAEKRRRALLAKLRD